MEYRSKAHVVEAFRYGMESEPDWFKEAVSYGIILIGYYANFCMYESEPPRQFIPGNYIVKLPHGHIYPCTAEEFETRYAAVKGKTDES